MAPRSYGLLGLGVTATMVESDPRTKPQDEGFTHTGFVVGQGFPIIPLLMVYTGRSSMFEEILMFFAGPEKFCRLPHPPLLPQHSFIHFPTKYRKSQLLHREITKSLGLNHKSFQNQNQVLNLPSTWKYNMVILHNRHTLKRKFHRLCKRAEFNH